MEFFVDTSFVIGLSDKNDEAFHKPCSEFRKKYPTKKYNYHSEKRLLSTEINNYKLKKSGTYNKVVFNFFIDRAEKFLDLIIDCSYKNHKSYVTLRDDINIFLLSKRKDNKRKNYDSILITNAFLWDFCENNLNKPHFITTDSGDFIANRNDLTSIAGKKLTYTVRLDIKHVEEMI